MPDKEPDIHLACGLEIMRLREEVKALRKASLRSESELERNNNELTRVNAELKAENDKLKLAAKSHEIYHGVEKLHKDNAMFRQQRDELMVAIKIHCAPCRIPSDYGITKVLCSDCDKSRICAALAAMGKQ
jgi:DNA gyrase/topoisomerase IV subunit A